MARTTINSLGIPNDTIVSADLDYPLTDFSSTGIDDNASTTALTIDSSGNITVTGYIAGPSTFTIDPAAVGDNTGTLVIAGNLQVDGTTTTINSTTMTVDDLNITLASGAANAAAANGAGITVDGASAALTYGSTNDAWSFNKNLGIGIDPVELLHVYDGNILIEEPDASTGTGLVIKNDSANQLIIRGAGSTRTNPGAATGMPQIVSTSGYDLYVAADGPDDVIFTTDRTERMRIADGGVNIGTGAPDSNITFGIDNQGFVVARYDLTAGVPTAGLGGVFSAAANVTDFSSGDLVLQCRPGVGGRSIKFFTGNTSTERMRIDDSGNVSIGVSSVSPVISSSKTLQLNSSGNTTLSVRAIDSVNDRSAILELLSSGNGVSKSIILYGDTDTTPGTASPLVIQKYHSGVRSEVGRFNTSGHLVLGDSTTAYYRLKSGATGTDGGIQWMFNTDATVFGSLTLPYDTRATTGLHLYSGYPITYTVPSNKAHQFVTGSSEAARIDADGMKFNGDTAAANALDDYEEGTWSAADASGQGLTVATNRSYYIKIGSLVYISASIVFPTTTNTANVALNIPFTSNVNGFYAGHGGHGYTNMNDSMGDTLVSVIENAGANVLFYRHGDQAIRYSDVSGARLDFHATYQRT
jgi:hypothetical protein